MNKCKEINRCNASDLFFVIIEFSIRLLGPGFIYSNVGGIRCKEASQPLLSLLLCLLSEMPVHTTYSVFHTRISFPISTHNTSLHVVYFLGLVVQQGLRSRLCRYFLNKFKLSSCGDREVYTKLKIVNVVKNGLYIR